MQTTVKSRHGFTLVEFLVVSGVAVMAMSFAPSAIQQAREAARQATCKNNLKQIGIALHLYDETYKTLPPAWTARFPTPGNGARGGWQFFLLPYVDEAHAPLYESIFFGVRQQPDWNLPTADAWTDEDLGIVLQTPIENYRCPSDPTSPTNRMRGNYGTSNYSGNHGNLSLPRWTTGRQAALWPGQLDTPRKANGIMFWNSNIGVRDITDGTSNTIMVGERSVTSAAGIWPGVGANDFENDAVTECSHGSRPNHSITSFSSPHEGGVHVVMCDGSVHFLSDSIDSKPVSEGDLGTYQRLANRHDGLPVGEF